MAVKDRPVPSIGDHDILVKTVSVALNPTDWKRTFIPLPSGPSV